MKIVQVCQRYYPYIGGIETHVREISEILVKRGFEVEVVCTDPSGKLPKQEIINGVKVTRFWAFSHNDTFFFSPAMYFYLKSLVYEIMHAHNYHAFPSLAASLTAKGRFVFTPHYHGGSSSYLRNLLLWPYKRLGCSIFEKAEKVICVSKYEMKLIENDFQIPYTKIIHIPNGLNQEEFKGIQGLKKDSKVILYTGRLESYKGVQYLIEALPLLPDYRLRVIGKGPYEKKLHEIAVKLNVNSSIDWLKDIERGELISHFKSADVFVNLSTFEAYGITVAEALACGTPCIVARGGALEEFIDGEGCTGINYPVNINALADTIKSRKKGAPRKMPDWEDITSKLIEIYTA